MPRKLYLHIGFPKSGSKSIQRAFFRYNGPLVRYLEIGRPTHSPSLFTIFSERRHQMGFYLANGVTPSEVDELKEDFKRRYREQIELDGKDMILSAEVAVFLQPPEVAAMKEYFSDFFDTIKVICYVREPIGFSGSNYQQDLRARFDRIAAPLPAYRDKLEKYLNLFPSKDVSVIENAAASLRGGSVVTDFANRIGEETQDVEDMRLNRSISRLAGKLLLHINRHGNPTSGSGRLDGAWHSFRMFLEETLEGSPLTLPAAMVQPQLDPSDLEWLNDATGIDFRSAAEPRSDGDEIVREFISEMENFDPDEVAALEHCLNLRGLRVEPEDGVLRMLEELFASFVKEAPVTDEASWRSRI
jgi:hypothetical protein